MFERICEVASFIPLFHRKPDALGAPASRRQSHEDAAEKAALPGLRRLTLQAPGSRRYSAALRIVVLALACSLVTAPCLAEDLVFRRHLIKDASESEFLAAAVYDVNRNGILDIVCGAFWYEGPSWKRHFLREVEVLGSRRPRPDGYAHQALDVNGNGWLDIVTANWRSGTLKWIEHPGERLHEAKEWTAHLIATPGPSETGRMVDILGDGTPALLPAGSRFAAWWELVRKPNPEGGFTPEWVRHDLPPELAGHGIGFGDINGNGRGDIVGSKGWAEAPEDRRNGRWIWHPDFDLGQAGIPILVADVNGDGLNDIVWTYGHDYGVFWLEQTRTEDDRIGWIRHTIDTSWAGAHAPLWEDLDGDGIKELIVGRRYLAHEGADPGEHDPQAGYRYQYDPQTRTWKRWVISYNDGVAYGLDPKAVDLNGNGRLDLVLAGRNGLYILENLGKGSTVARGETRDPLWFPTYTDRLNLMVVRDESGRERPVEDGFDWGQRRAHTLAAAQQVLGELPDSYRRVPLDVQVLSETAHEGYVRREITYASDFGSRVSAYLLIPDEARRNGAAMICLHDDTPLGKGEPVGGGRDFMTYAKELAGRGYICLVPDYPSFGESIFDSKSGGYAGGAMKAIWDNIRGLDLLQSMPAVGHRRIGAIGHGLGGLNALLTAAFDYRISAVVVSGGFTTFPRYSRQKLTHLAGDRFIPRIRDRYGMDPAGIPFDFSELIATLAPRGVFISAPLGDETLDVKGVQEAVAAALPVYDLRGAPEGSLHAIHPDAGHVFPEETRVEAYSWLDRRLSSQGSPTACDRRPSAGAGLGLLAGSRARRALCGSLEPRPARLLGLLGRHDHGMGHASGRRRPVGHEGAGARERGGGRQAVPPKDG